MTLDQIYKTIDDMPDDLAPMAPDEAQTMLARVGTLAPDYAPLAPADAVRWIMFANSVDQTEASFRYSLALGAPGDVITETAK